MRSRAPFRNDGSLHQHARNLHPGLPEIGKPAGGDADCSAAGHCIGQANLNEPRATTLPVETSAARSSPFHASGEIREARSVQCDFGPIDREQIQIPDDTATGMHPAKGLIQLSFSFWQASGHVTAYYTFPALSGFSRVGLTMR